MPNLGVPELLIILFIVVIFFGVGRISEIGGAMGKGIREFRKAADGGLVEKSSTEEGKSSEEGKSGE